MEGLNDGPFRPGTTAPTTPLKPQLSQTCGYLYIHETETAGDGQMRVDEGFFFYNCEYEGV